MFLATSENDGNKSSPYSFVDFLKSHPQSAYDCSIALFNTAGIAAYIGQHTLNISTSLSICSYTCIPLGKLNGSILNSSDIFGLVPYTETSESFPNTSLYSPFAGSITRNLTLFLSASSSIW